MSVQGDGAPSRRSQPPPPPPVVGASSLSETELLKAPGPDTYCQSLLPAPRLHPLLYRGQAAQ